MFGAPGVGPAVRGRAVPAGLPVTALPLPRRVVDALPGDGGAAAERAGRRAPNAPREGPAGPDPAGGGGQPPGDKDIRWP